MEAASRQPAQRRPSVAPSVYKPSFPSDPHAAPWNEADNIAWSEDTTRNLIAVEEAATFLQYYKGTVRLKMKGKPPVRTAGMSGTAQAAARVAFQFQGSRSAICLAG
jgi:hypothetical protein